MKHCNLIPDFMFDFDRLTLIYANQVTLVSRFGAIALMIASPYLADGANPSTPMQATAAILSEKDKTFMTNIAHRGVEEIAMGKLAETQGRSADVTNFAKQVISERTMINNELSALAARKSFALPKESAAVAIGHNPKLGALAWGAGYAGSGGIISNYDKRWSSEMEKDLRDDLSDCAEEGKNGSAADVKAWALKAFEMIRKDLLTVMDIRSKLK